VSKDDSSGVLSPRPSSALQRLLRQAGLFAGLDDVYLAELISRSRLRDFEVGQTMFLEGDRASGLFVITQGRVKVFKTSPKGREQILLILGPGEPVGEVAVLSGEAYPASSESIEPVSALYVPRQVFLDLIAREPEVAMRLLAALSARLRSFATLIEDLSLRDVAQRLAAHLLSLAEERADGQMVDLGVSKTQLSAAVGTVPETLSRAFQQLTRCGALETKGRHIRIKSRSVLEKVAGVKQ